MAATRQDIEGWFDRGLAQKARHMLVVCDSFDCDDAESRAMCYEQYSGQRPHRDDYMPNWPESERTHLMMYEDTSEGTPISPAFATPEELARWLTDNGASAFGDSTGSYEGWLRAAQGGWAPSAVFTPQTGLVSGVDAL